MKSMKRTKTMKRLALDALCAALIAVMMCATAFAGTETTGTGAGTTAAPTTPTTTATVPEGFITDANGLMAYQIQEQLYGDDYYNFKGYVNGAWRQITHSDAGNVETGFLARAWTADRSIQNNLQISATPKFIAGGKAIQVDYTVKNIGDTAVSGYRFFFAERTKIDGEDGSLNIADKGRQSVIMKKRDGSVSFFALSTTKGCTPVATAQEESGNDDVCYDDIYGNHADPSMVTPYENPQRSALVMYFPSETLDAGASKTYTLIVGMGGTSEIDEIIGDVNGDAAKKASPETGDNSNLALWLALLFVSGGAVAGGAFANKKRKFDR